MQGEYVGKIVDRVNHPSNLFLPHEQLNSCVITLGQLLSSLQRRAAQHLGYIGSTIALPLLFQKNVVHSKSKIVPLPPHGVQTFRADRSVPLAKYHIVNARGDAR